MTLYLILIVVCTLLGGTALWFSGFLSRRPAPPASPASDRAPLPAPAADGQVDALTRRISELESVVESALEDRKNFEHQTRQAVEDKVNLDEEVIRMSVELGQLENDKGRLENEISRLKEELDGFKQRPKPKLPVPPLPQPSPSHTSPTNIVSEEIDTLTAQLDMERVAHQKTREELELLKKAPVAAPPAPERRAFPTMAFAARPSLTGSDDDGLQKSLEKIQAEKDEIEAELVKTRQELQFLKMRQ